MNSNKTENTNQTLPSVSIIVPVYGVESSLSKCIESIIAQSFDKWELILIDDGSPDKSGEICDYYASNDSRIKVIHKNNEGVSIARNTGIKEATGKYICFVDSDDYVGSKYVVSLLNLVADEDTIVYGNVRHIRNRQQETIAFSYDTGVVIDKENGAELIPKYGIIENGFPVAKLFPMKLINKNKIKFNPELSLHEDHIFVLQVLNAASKIIISNNADYFYVHQISGNSLSQKSHPPLKLSKAADELLNQIDLITNKFNIEDSSYKRKTYTLLGLNQLVKAYLISNNADESKVINEIRRKFTYFRKYYRPNHKFARLIPLLVASRFNIIISGLKIFLKH